MTSSDATSSKARDALIRASKDLIAINIIELCKDLHIRAMLGGGPVLNAHGLIAPGISRFASLVVDPASIRDLRFGDRALAFLRCLQRERAFFHRCAV